MAPLLTSSAAGGVKVAPKAPPRRRPAAPPSKPVDPPSRLAASATNEVQQVRFADPVETSSPRPQSQPQPQQPAEAPPSEPPARHTEEATAGPPAAPLAELPAESSAGPPAGAPVGSPAEAAAGLATGSTTGPVAKSTPEPIAQAQDELEHEAVAPSVAPPAPIAPMLEPTTQKALFNDIEQLAEPALHDKATATSPGVPESQPSAGNEQAPAKRKRAEKAVPTQPAAKRRKSTRNDATEPTLNAETPTATPARRGRRKIQTPTTVVENDDAASVAIGGESGFEQEEQREGAAPKPKQPRKPRQPRQKKVNPTTPESSVGEANIAGAVEQREGQENAAPKSKKPRKPRQPRQRKGQPILAPAEEENNGDAEGGKDSPEHGADAETFGGVNMEQEAEVSDPELHEIDPNTLSMFNISYQKRYGKTSEREKKMAEINWEEVKRRRRAEAEQPVLNRKERERQRREQQQTHGQDPEGMGEENADGSQAGEGTEYDNENDINNNDAEPDTRAVDTGLRFRMVNGEIVADEETLQIDRAAQAQAEVALEAPVEEETDLTQLSNRMQYLNDRKRFAEDRVPAWKAKADPWSFEETERFYEALRNWGTDFMIISQLFRPKTRMQVKKKFTREEKIDPQRVNDALLGKDTSAAHVRMDLSAYAEAVDLDLEEFNKFDSLEHADRVIRESLRDKEVAMQAAVAEEEEVERQRAVQAEQKAEAKSKREKKKRETQAKKLARSKGVVWGTGTFGGVGGGGEEE